LKKMDFLEKVAAILIEVLATDGHRLTLFLDADCAEGAEFLVSLVYLANFAPKASFVAKLCLRPRGHLTIPLCEAD
jgi:hypothetical protein